MNIIKRSIISPWLILVAALLMACAAPELQKASNQQTSLLEPQAGYVGDGVGAEVKDVNYDPENQMTVMRIAVPRKDQAIKSVRVANVENTPIKQVKPVVIQQNPDQEETGIILYLDKRQKLPFRLFFNDAEF